MNREVSVVSLKDGVSGVLVAAELYDQIGENELHDWDSHWRPYLYNHVVSLHHKGIPASAWPQQLHWDWRKKANPKEMLLSERGFAVRARDMTQGLMLVSLVHEARLPAQAGKPLVYVEYLESAPWNQIPISSPPSFRGIGSVLIATAISLSREEGFGGRIGLHSLPQSDSFYTSSCQMSNLGPDSHVQNLRYFEMTAEQADSFLPKGGAP